MPQVRIEKLVYQGYGLARSDGKTVFVRRAAPGDFADVRITESRRNFDLALIEVLVEPSPERTEPPCPFFKQGCGGCQWQHLEYASQLEWKRKIFLEFLERNHFSQPFPPLTACPSPPLHYRARFHFHLAESGKPALFREHTHELVTVDHCWLLPEKLNHLLSRLHKAGWLSSCESFQIWLDDLDSAGLETTPSLAAPLLASVRQEFPGLKILHPLSPDRMQYQIGEFVFLVGEQSFFQTNRFLSSRLNETVCTLAGSGSMLLDLYSGIGFFTLPLSSQFTRVVGVEENTAGAREAEANARSNGVGNVEFIADKVEHYLETAKEDFDFMLADPPRAGLSKKTVRSILGKRPERMVYVSCDPTTLVRDLQWLSESYQVRQFFLFDLFPQTFHFETVAELVWRG